MNIYLLIGILLLNAIAIGILYYIVYYNKQEINREVSLITKNMVLINKNQIRLSNDMKSLYKFSKGIEKPILNQLYKLKRSVSQITKTK